jgi:hypothetical protein
MLASVDLRGSLSTVLVLALGCSNAPDRPRASEPKPGAGEVVRYRLELRHNKVSPGEAFRCYGGCQKQSTPGAYLECLAACPGFEITPGVGCAKYEVPPEAACLTVRKIPKATEPPPGVVVLAVIGSFLLVVGASSLCAASSSQCGYMVGPGYQPPPF